MSLTDVVVRKAKASGKTCKFFDERGLYLEVSPTGGKWWRFKYRFSGKEKRLAFGVYPDVGLKDARESRDAARKLLAAGVDPGEHRKAQKLARTDQEANSFEVVAREWFAKYAATWAASHSERTIRRFERDVFPWIGRKPIADIHAPEILLSRLFCSFEEQYGEISPEIVQAAAHISRLKAVKLLRCLPID